jgi:isopentenyl-diphosphate delta-isomerase
MSSTLRTRSFATRTLLSVLQQQLLPKSALLLLLPPASSLGGRTFITKSTLNSHSFHSKLLKPSQQKRSFAFTVSETQGNNKTIMKDWEANLDPVQKKLLEEECILLDNDDRVIGHDSKKNCHLIRNGDVKLHRAFSVFLFNSKGKQ